ncbi:hypothetical protein V492_04484 [Pseudogymnoascus sp. VKM F-4246]|nr:hypothetical protein V492_04484 [Pseudogymnoascus sp. VKM F-4246]
MSQSPDSAREIRAEKRRRESSSTSGFGNLTRHISQSFGIRKKSNQLGNTRTIMPPKKGTNGLTVAQTGERVSPTNGNSAKRPSNSTNRPSSHAQSVVEPDADLGPLAQEFRNASKQLSSIQEAINAITMSCNQHADDITQIPKFREEYENLTKKAEDKDITIANLKTAIDVLEQRTADRDKAAADDIEANSTERERLKHEKVRLDQKNREVDEALERKKLELEEEATKMLSQRMKGLDEKFETQKKDLEIDIEKQKKELNKQLERLKTKTKKDLETIDKLTAQIDELRHELQNEVGRSEDIDQARGGYKREKEQLTKKLRNLQEEFSLNCEPLEYYQSQFLAVSHAVQSISARYLARDLTKEEITGLPSAMSAVDSTFSDVPFSNTEASKHLRIAHAQRVISDAVYSIAWQPFSSDITMADPKLSRFLREVGIAVGSGRSADVWRAVTMRALESMSVSNTQSQHISPQASNAANNVKNREDRLVEEVLSVLRPLLERSDLTQFEADLLQIAKQAILIWSSAQADERIFTVNPNLNEENKHDWETATLDYVPLSTDGGNQVVGLMRQNATSVFTLFPIITATKKVQVQKADHGPPGSWPDQDQQQLLNTEVKLVHAGVGLPQESNIVQEGIAEREEFKRMRLEHEESWDHKWAQKIAEKGHSRKSSIAGTISGPSSPSATWGTNKLNNHKTGN